MKPPSVPVTGPKLRLIEAAETLFAEQGFDTVSVRDITKAAKANVAAVNYHFGSREGIISATLTRYLAPLNDERILRLDQAEATHGNKPLPLELIVDAFTRPLATHPRHFARGEAAFLKLLGRSLAHPLESLPPALETQATTLFSRFLHALAKSIPGVPADDLAWRLHFVSGALHHMLTHAADLHQLTAGTSGKPTTDALLSRFNRFALASLGEGHSHSAPHKNALETPPLEPKDPNQGLLFDF